MDLIAILFGAMKGLLFMVMLFGAYLAFKQMDKGKIRTLFVSYLLFWALLLFMDVYNMVSVTLSGSPVQLINPLLALFSVLVSQMVLLWFFYNLLFTFKRSLKILAAHLAIVAVVLALVQSVNHVEVAQFFNLSDTLAHAYEGISVQSMCFKTLIVAMQLGFTLVALFVSHKLIPIYQKYIEQNESNAAYNLLWIKEVGRIALLVTTAYVFLMVFITYTTAIIYYAVLIVAYMRMINILIQHVTLDNFDELYDRLGVKWSWRKMWYVEQNASNLVSDAKTQYGAIIEWINSDHPYVNPQFSFKEIVMQFSGVTYNDFNELIEEDKGMNFQAYVRECRINHAVELMDRADNLLLLKEIASKVGFDSSTAFSRAFKAVKGVSASEWRVRK